MKVSFVGPYTNTVIGFFILIFMVVQFIKFVSYFVGIVQHPEIKRKFPFFSFIVFLFFAFSLVVVFVLSVVARPSTPIVITSTPTRRIPTMTSVPTHPPLPTPATTDCLKWDQVNASMEGEELPCVYGDVANYVENPTLNATYFYFGSREQFYFVISDMYYPDFKDGDCAQSLGVVKLDTYKTPYIKIADLYTCE